MTGEPDGDGRNAAKTSAGSGGNPLGQVLDTVASLMRNEVDLARAEVAQGIRAAAMGVALLVVAVIAALAGVNLLAGSAVAFLVERQGLSPTLAAITVAGVLIFIAALLVWRGVHDIRRADPARLSTRKNLHRDVQTVKESYHADRS